MISERKFANSFTSFWREALPRAEGYLRRMNCSLERIRPPLESVLPTDRESRAVINELGFRLFMRHAAGDVLTTDETNSIAADVVTYVKRIENPLISPEPRVLTEGEIGEAREICGALAEFFTQAELRQLQFWPEFAGCGFINTCKADIIQDQCLIEVKAGDRSFRLTDLRQILVYCALAFAARAYQLDAIVMINPRRGVYYEASVEELSVECSGAKPVDLFSEIITFVTSEPNSR